MLLLLGCTFSHCGLELVHNNWRSIGSQWGGGSRALSNLVQEHASPASSTTRKKNNHNGTYVIELHRYFSFEVAVEDKSLQHQTQVCTMTRLEIKFSTRTCIETALSVPFLKRYKPKTEGAKLIFTIHSRGYNFLNRVQKVQFLCIVG